MVTCVCMCVCIYACVHVCMRVYVHVHVCAVGVARHDVCRTSHLGPLLQEETTPLPEAGPQVPTHSAWDPCGRIPVPLPLCL